MVDTFTPHLLPVHLRIFPHIQDKVAFGYLIPTHYNINEYFAKQIQFTTIYLL
jgi:hypothetical protein